MDIDAVFVIGPQGSGKGTQAKLLAKKLGFFAWDMGAVLREEHDRNVTGGETVGEIIDRGQLLTDEQLLEVFQARFANIPKGQGVIFDGIPRRIGQAEFLVKFLREQGKSKFLTLFLNVPHEESMKRLLLRAEKEGRKDDTKESIEYRLRQYEEATIPVLDYLKGCGTFIEIDGSPSIEDVTISINRALHV